MRLLHLMMFLFNAQLSICFGCKILAHHDGGEYQKAVAAGKQGTAENLIVHLPRFLLWLAPSVGSVLAIAWQLGSLLKCRLSLPVGELLDSGLSLKSMKGLLGGCSLPEVLKLSHFLMIWFCHHIQIHHHGGFGCSVLFVIIIVHWADWLTEGGVQLTLFHVINSRAGVIVMRAIIIEINGKNCLAIFLLPFRFLAWYYTPSLNVMVITEILWWLYHEFFRELISLTAAFRLLILVNHGLIRLNKHRYLMLLDTPS